MQKTLVNLGIIVAIFFSCAFFQIVLVLRADKLERQEVATISGSFPIVVVTGDKAQIVYGEDLENFRHRHSDYSFLVPAEKYEIFQKQIESNTRANSASSNKESIRFWEAGFTVEALSPERQRLVVFATWDDDRVNTGEYEATEKDLFPKYHKAYFGPGKVMATFPTALLFTAVLWSVSGITIWLWRRKKRLK